MSARRIEVAGLRSRNEMESAIAGRMDNVARAEEFAGRTFGEDALRYMTDLRERSGGKPTFVLARQIAKPDLQHAALYLGARSMGYGLATMEWTRDFMSMSSDGYKRSYVDIPLGYIGNKGNLVTKHVKVMNKLPTDVALVCGNVRICDIDIPADGVAMLKKELGGRMCTRLAASLEGRSHKIGELHTNLRNRIEGADQLVPDVSELGDHAVLGLLRTKANVPGLGEAKLFGSGHATRVDKIGGQLMNVLSFTLQNVAPNMVLAVTDWNGDDEIIRQRYGTAVSFLEGNGLNEPLQFIIPNLHEMLRDHVSQSYGSFTPLDTVVPARADICNLARHQPSESLGTTFIEAGSAIIDGMKEAKQGEVYG